MMRLKTLFLILAIAAGFTGYGVNASELIVESPRVRLMPPGAHVSALFVDLTSREGGAVVEAASPLASNLELHKTEMHEGTMRMRKIERIPLPAGERVSLKPGGLHIMLIGLVRDLHLGEKVPVLLKFENGEQVEFNAPVTKVELPRQQTHHNNMHHDTMK